MYQANYKYICSTYTTIYHTYTWICRVQLERSRDLVFFFVCRRPAWQMMFKWKMMSYMQQVNSTLGAFYQYQYCIHYLLLMRKKINFFFHIFWIITIRKYLLWVTLSEEVLYPCDLLSLMHNSSLYQSCLSYLGVHSNSSRVWWIFALKTRNTHTHTYNSVGQVDSLKIRRFHHCTVLLSE